MDLTKEQQEEIIRFTQALVRCPGSSGDESKAAAALTGEMGKLGYDSVETDQWGNVIGTIQGDRPGPTIVLDGHMDVFPIGDPQLWHCDPFGGEIADGKIWGRGTSDMKGGLAAAVCAAAFADRAKIAGTILVTGSVAEELMIGQGLGKVLAGRKADAVVTCEPTGLANLAVAGVGRTTVEMTVHGLAAHSSQPQLGDNAVYRAMDACERIRKMPRREDALFGREVIELVEVKSQPSPGNGCVPDYCWVLWESRLLPGETQARFQGRFRDAVKDVAGAEKIEFKIGQISRESYPGAQLDYVDFLNAWVTSDTEPFRMLFERAMLACGIQVNPVVFRACTNVNVSAGDLGIPSLIYGPGSLALAHKPNEFIEIDELLLSAQVYKQMIDLTSQIENAASVP